jgi:hypothetical protein
MDFSLYIKSSKRLIHTILALSLILIMRFTNGTSEPFEPG